MRIIKDIEAEVKCQACTRILGVTPDDIQVNDVGPDTFRCVCGNTCAIHAASLSPIMRHELAKKAS